MKKTVKEQANDESRAVASVINGYANRIDQACEIIYQNSQQNADDPKLLLWILDEVLRALQRDKYEQWIIDATNDGAEDWDTGTAP